MRDYENNNNSSKVAEILLSALENLKDVYKISISEGEIKDLTYKKMLDTIFTFELIG